jgi:hypothetical protein
MSTSNKNGFLLLASSKDEWYKQLSLDEIQKLVNENKAWFDRLAAQGKVKGGQALARSGATISGRNGWLVSDGPFAESKEAVGGYLLLDVQTLEEAIAIARTIPSLAYETSIEVRPVAEECPVNVYARELAQQELATVSA